MATGKKVRLVPYLIENVQLGSQTTINSYFFLSFNVAKPGYTPRVAWGFCANDRGMASAIHVSSVVCNSDNTVTVGGYADSSLNVSASAYVTVAYTKNV